MAIGNWWGKELSRNIFYGDVEYSNPLPAQSQLFTQETTGRPTSPAEILSAVPSDTMRAMVHEDIKDITETVLIPAGEFLMGSQDEEGESDEYPQHVVYLDAFYIDKYEVINAQYKKFIDATGYPTPLYWNDDRFNKLDQPVVGVTWYDAEAYCKWAGKRLSTEAEWEKAARGMDERRYPWGNESPNAGGTWKANYYIGINGADDGFEFAAPVGSFPEGASPYGVMDMAGNVWEWVADWYDNRYYSSSPKSNPKGPSSGRIYDSQVYRVIRGGSWDNAAGQFLIRSANRDRLTPDTRSWYVGFRCAQDVSP